MRWAQQDPTGYSDYTNTYNYLGNNVAGRLDPKGTDTYTLNRKLGGTAVKSSCDILSHTFTYTTNADGTLHHTYSWGNAAGTNDWHMDQPEDIAAAKAAIARTNKDAWWEGDSGFDPYVQQAYNLISVDPAYHHRNWVVYKNCKFETKWLIKKAKAMGKADGWRLKPAPAAPSATSPATTGPATTSPAGK